VLNKRTGLVSVRGSPMRVHLIGFTDTDAIVVIECECGNSQMLDEAGDFPAERIYVYRHGVPTKNLRCCAPGAVTLKRISMGKPECQERYRITLQTGHNPPRMEIAHISPRPRKQLLETVTIPFPGAPI
jgi:hypothetical protein